MALRGFFYTCFFLSSLLLGPMAFTQWAIAQGGGPVGATQGPDPDALDRRLDKLEEQMVDLQSQAATLETLANSAPSAPDAGGDTPGRSSGLEAQVQTLSAQLAEMTQRMQQMERQLGIAPSRNSSTGPAQTLPPLREQTYGQPSRQQQGYSGGQDRPSTGGGFGSTTVEPGDAPGQASSSEPPRRYASPQGAYPPSNGGQGYGATEGAQSQSAKASSSEAKTLYDQAFGSFAKREYDAAETYFTQFIKQYPNDGLVGPAQYYLGETIYQAGDYRQAADIFLKTYTDYPNFDKAPDALFKLGLSLKRLGEGRAACETFSEVEQKFPQAQSVVQRAQAEKRRSNC